MELTYNGPGERIDKRLTTQFPYARNFFHHIISRDGIQVNKKIVKKSFKLKDGDIVLIDDLKRYLSPVILDEAPKIDLEIKLEKEDYLVLYKPKGVLSHPNSVWDVSQPSVVGFLYHKFKNLPTVGNFIRSGLIHRLDKETDGLMIIAKTEKGLAHFKSLFQQKSLAETAEAKELVELKKYYRAVCYITEKGQSFLDEITDKLPFTIQEMVVPKVPHSVAKMGITKIISVKSFKSGNVEMVSKSIDPLLRCSVCPLLHIELEILTGRTHQIRYHLSTHGLPIVGDYLYGKDENIDMQLTARKLEFRDTEGEKVVVEF